MADPVDGTRKYDAQISWISRRRDKTGAGDPSRSLENKFFQYGALTVPGLNANLYFNEQQVPPQYRPFLAIGTKFQATFEPVTEEPHKSKWDYRAIALELPLDEQDEMDRRIAVGDIPEPFVPRPTSDPDLAVPPPATPSTGLVVEYDDTEDATIRRLIAGGAIPQITVDTQPIGPGHYRETFGLFLQGRAFPGQLNFVPKSLIGWRKAGDNWVGKSDLFSEEIPETGRIVREVAVRERTSMYINVEGFDEEYTLEFPRPRYGARAADPSEPVSFHFFSGWHTGKRDMRAFSRVIFASLSFMIFMWDVLVGYLGKGALPLVAGAILLSWVVSLILMNVGKDEGARKARARFIGWFPRLFMKSNNRWALCMSLMTIITFVMYFRTPPAPTTLTAPTTAAEIRAEQQERMQDARAGGRGQSIREKALAEIRKGNTSPALVSDTRFYSILFFLFATLIYGFVALTDEAKAAYFKIEERFFTSMREDADDTKVGFIQKLLRQRFGRPAPAAVNFGANVVKAATAPQHYIMALIWEIGKEALASRINRKVDTVLPTLLKGRR